MFLWTALLLSTISVADASCWAFVQLSGGRKTGTMQGKKNNVYTEEWVIGDTVEISVGGRTITVDKFLSQTPTTGWVPFKVGDGDVTFQIKQQEALTCDGVDGCISVEDTTVSFFNPDSTAWNSYTSSSVGYDTMTTVGSVTCPASCDDEYIARLSWVDMTNSEIDVFFNALQELYDRDAWTQFAYKHHHHTDYAHDTKKYPGFGVFHRAFNWQLEIQIQQLGAPYTCVGIPYWDFSASAGDEPNAPVWGPIEDEEVVKYKFGPYQFNKKKNAFKNGVMSGVNLNGDTEYQGRFMGWKNPMTDLSRKVQTKTSVWENEIEQASLLQLDPATEKNYHEKWMKRLSSLHGSVHVWVGMTMKESWAPLDPLFFVVHSNVDRLFSLWKNCHFGDIDHASSYENGKSLLFPDGSASDPIPGYPQFTPAMLVQYGPVPAGQAEPAWYNARYVRDAFFDGQQIYHNKSITNCISTDYSDFVHAVESEEAVSLLQMQGQAAVVHTTTPLTEYQQEQETHLNDILQEFSVYDAFLASCADYDPATDIGFTEDSREYCAQILKTGHKCGVNRCNADVYPWLHAELKERYS